MPGMLLDPFRYTATQLVTEEHFVIRGADALICCTAGAIGRGVSHFVSDAGRELVIEHHAKLARRPVFGALRISTKDIT